MTLKPHSINHEEFERQGVWAGTHEGMTYEMDYYTPPPLADVVELEPHRNQSEIAQVFGTTAVASA